MTNHGIVLPGSTLEFYAASYDGATGASEALSGLAVTDIEIYKNGSTTQRSSDTGYTLLDTDGIDFDSITGLNGFSVDLSSNADAGFFVAGGRYVVVVSSVTVDGQTVNYIAGMFSIGHPKAIVNTTIATLASQTSFTLTAGSADNSAYVGCVAYIHDVASAVQCCMGVISAYTGSTKTVTLAADPGIFTVAAGDNIMILPRTNVYSVGGTAQTPRDLGASVLLSSGTGTGQLDFTSGVVKANLAQILGTALTETAGQIAAAFKKFFDKATPTGTINSLPDAVPGANGGLPTTNGTKVNQTVDLTAGQSITASSVTAAVTVGTNNDKTGYSLGTTPPTAVQIRQEIDSNSTQLAAIVADTSELQGDWANGGRLDLILDARASQASVDTVDGIVDSILDDTGTSGVVVAATSKAGYSLATAPPTASEIKTAVEADGSKLDHLWEMTEDDGGVRRLTTNALENAPTGTGGFTSGDRSTLEAIPTLAEIEASTALAMASAVATVDTVVDGIATTLGSAGAGLTSIPNSAGVTTLLSRVPDTISLAAINAEVDTALNTAIPGSPTVDSINERVKAIDDKLPASPAAVGSQMDLVNAPNATAVTAIQAGLSTLTTAQVNSEVATALADVNLDHLVGTATGIPSVPAGTFLDQVMDDGTATFDRTTDSLQAIRDSGGVSGITVEQIADAVWDEATAGHASSGTFGKLMSFIKALL